MTHDQLWGSGLVLAAIALFAVLAVADARRDRSRLPGALASEDRAGFDAGLRAQRDEGMGVLEAREVEHWPSTCPECRRQTELGVEAVEPDPVAPVYEGTVIDWLERSYSWPEVYDYDEWPGDVG